MNKHLLLALAFVTSTPFLVSNVAIAAEEDIENACYDLADKKDIAEDKYDAFVAKCIEDAKAKSN